MQDNQNNITNCRRIKELRIEKILRNKIKQDKITKFIKLDKDKTKQEQNKISKFIELSWNKKRRKRNKISRFNKLNKIKRENLYYLDKIWARLNKIKLIKLKLDVFEVTRYYRNKTRRFLLFRQNLNET